MAGEISVVAPGGILPGDGNQIGPVLADVAVSADVEVHILRQAERAEF